MSGDLHSPRPAGRVLLLVILLIAFGLRVHRLGVQSLWYDEAVTAQVASQGIAELTRWTADDIQPPLYYYVVAGWMRLAGHSEWALRFPSVFFGVLTPALLWTLARRLFPGAPRGAMHPAIADPALGGSWTLRERNVMGCDAGSTIAALVAALLAALSPLYVYYAQEARMYALLTFLAALAGYALLRATHPRHSRAPIGDWITFVLASAAMLYVHYFGLFLLATYAVCLALAWARGAVRPRGVTPAQAPVPEPVQAAGRGGALRILCRPVGAFLTILLLYVPWLPAMLTRYRVDRSYWQGSLKLGEALRHLAISFTVGAPETMLEPTAVTLLPGFGVALGVAVIATWWAWRPRWTQGHERAGFLIYLITCLAVPALAILTLASRTPKFNARYLMMVSPAYLLLLAGGIGALVGGQRERGAGENHRAGAAARSEPRWITLAARFSPYARRGLAALVLIFLITTSVASLRNWFFSPAFTKTQWREAAAVVRQEIAPAEVVLLVSGHAYPAWDYYAADIPRIRLPHIDILDVEAVLGFEDAALLARDLAGKTGAWLVSWQNEAVDPVGFAPYFLDRAGSEQPVREQLWHIGLRHWLLRSDATYPVEPRPQHIEAANYAHQLALLGWDDPAAGRITVYWCALNTIHRDYQVSLILEDATGREVGRWDGRPAGYDYPTFRWQPGQALFGRYPLPSTTSTGEHYVTLALYDAVEPSGLDLRDIADNPAGKRVRFGPFRLQ